MAAPARGKNLYNRLASTHAKASIVTTAAPPARGPSVIEAAQQAIEHTRRQLFPFRFERWLVLGCVALLDQCGRHQGVGGFNVPGPGNWGGGSGGGGSDGGDATRALEWLGAHAAIVAAVAAAVLAAIVVVIAIVLWLNSRGVFMYLDNVASGRADFERPWREHAERAQSYFAWSFGMSLAVLVTLCVLLAGALVAVAALVTGPPGTGLTAGIGLGGLLVLFLLLVVSAALASLALRDFVAPLQVRTGASCGAAIQLLLALVRAHPGTFVVYLLLKIVFAIALSLVTLVAACLTCCCVLLPVVMQTALQPLFYFERAWSLHLLRQLGYDLLVPAA
jgi:hypothetical protein